MKGYYQGYPSQAIFRDGAQSSLGCYLARNMDAFAKDEKCALSLLGRLRE